MKMENNALQAGSELQNGKYCIVSTLGQGGFGITYFAEQVALGRKVALKEFFMKDCCERDTQTSHMTVGTGSQRELVEKFRGKFIREARMLASFDHPGIVRVYDVFEENGTAYYVMENLSGGSLSDKVKKAGPLSEEEAERYVRQVADALAYIHERNTVHLDVKPSNILLNAKGEAVLIDFGISKHYDSAGEQTSSTPVGVSKGYAPHEQSKDGDVSQFGPSTDIYALGATLYNLLTGLTPPDSSTILDEGLARPAGITDRMWHVIETAMRPRRKDRPQSIAAFLSLLEANDTNVEEEVTQVKPGGRAGSVPGAASGPEANPAGKPKTWLWALLAGVVVLGVVLAFVFRGGRSGETSIVQQDTIVAPANRVSAQEAASKPDPVIPGSVKISSTPSGASIWLDGKDTKKTTPEILEDLSPGTHKVKLVLDGYKDYSGSVSITSGKRSELSRTLTAKETAASTSPQAVSPAQQSNNPPVAEKPSTGRENGHEWVDLGLSVKWATCNVGASSPSDYGGYYAWGETSTKSDYSWETYKFRVSGDSSYEYIKFSKYNTKSGRGSIDNKTRLDLSDDTARQIWGGRWRIPTRAECEELKSKCTCTWTTQGGKNGYKVTSKKNGNSIFLPAAGDRDGSSLNKDGSYGYCWSSSLTTEYPYDACSMSFHSGVLDTYRSNRYLGFSVRPVTE